MMWEVCVYNNSRCGTFNSSINTFISSNNIFNSSNDGFTSIKGMDKCGDMLMGVEDHLCPHLLFLKRGECNNNNNNNSK